MRREDRSSISSHPLADLGGNRMRFYVIAVFLVGAVPLFVPIGAVPSSRPAIAAGRRAQGLSRLAALCGHPQGLALTAPSTVPRSCRLGRRRARLHAFECALLVENAHAMRASRFQAGKVANEDLYWDRATVLSQLGVLDHPVAAAGVESTAKLLKLRNYRSWHQA